MYLGRSAGLAAYAVWRIATDMGHIKDRAGKSLRTVN
jgi:hypothetical protein